MMSRLKQQFIDLLKIIAKVAIYANQFYGIGQPVGLIEPILLLGRPKYGTDVMRLQVSASSKTKASYKITLYWYKRFEIRKGWNRIFQFFTKTLYKSIENHPDFS